MDIKLIIYHLSFIIRKSFIIRRSGGFTLIELAVVTLITVTLLGFITISLVRSQQTASLTSVVDVLQTDLRQQQLRSMVGDTEGRPESDSYGIHFDANRYVLFHGSSYSPLENSNFIVNLDDNMQINNSDYEIIFSKKSGEISSAATIELQDNTNSKLKRIHVNTLGVVTQVESL